MSRSLVPSEYSKGFRRALRRVLTAQLDDGRLELDSPAVADLFDRADATDVIGALVETVAVMASEQEGDGSAADRIEHAVAQLGERKRSKSKKKSD